MEKRDKILIVDDDPLVVRLLKSLLDKNYDIITANNAAKAMELAKSEIPDLILLDIFLVDKSYNSSTPIINGIEICKTLSKDEITKTIPIILISQNIQEKDVANGLDAGAVDYIKKPFSLMEVLARIRAALRTKQSYSNFLNEENTLTFRQIVLLEYPAPLALSYKRMVDEREPFIKHNLIGDLFEVMLKYCASIAIGQYLKDKIYDKKINNELQKLERPSIGSWASFFHEILEFYHKNNKKLVIPELYDFYNKKNKSLVASKECYDILSLVLDRKKFGGILTIKQLFDDILINYRNKTRGHGATNSEKEYEKRVNYLQPALEEILGEMKFISRFKLGYVKQIIYKRGIFEHTIVLLTGVDTPHRIYSSKDDNRLEDHCTYLFSEEKGELKAEINLSPFIIHDFCEKCKRDQIFFLNEGKDKGIEYLSYQCGDTFMPSTIYLEDFKKIMTQISFFPEEEKKIFNISDSKGIGIDPKMERKLNNKEKVLIAFYVEYLNPLPDIDNNVNPKKLGINVTEFYVAIENLQNEGLIIGAKFQYGGDNPYPLAVMWENVKLTRQGIEHIEQIMEINNKTKIDKTKAIFEKCKSWGFEQIKVLVQK